MISISIFNKCSNYLKLGEIKTIPNFYLKFITLIVKNINLVVHLFKIVMKRSLFLTYLVITSLFVSCSNDEENENGGANFTIPLQNNSYWTYDVNSNQTTSRDSLYISGDVVLNSKNYKLFQTQNDRATGFYSSSLRNNGLRKEDAKLLLSGSLSLNSGLNLPLDLDFVLDDFIIFNSDATNNQALNNTPITGVIQETYNGIPIIVTYSLQSFGGESYTNFTAPNGDSFNNVIATKIKLNVSIVTQQSTGGFTFTVPVLPSQDVIVSTLYIANTIGVVYVNTDTNYTLNSDIASEFGLNPSGTQNQKEYLDTYKVN